MPSHLLANSAFAGLDIYGSSKPSKRLVPARPIRPAEPPLTQLDAARRSSLALPDAMMPSPSPLIPGRSTSLTEDILLNAPELAHHATSVDMEGEARRGPVQMSNVVNWARPFNAEPEEQYLFGQSNQRQRRMGKSTPISPYVASPSSSSASSDEESLPTTPGAIFFPSTPFAQSLSGLGMDLPKTDMRSQWSQKQEVARRIHSLPTGAPTTLEELRQLKTAAQQLETEARRRAIIPVSASPVIEQKPLEQGPSVRNRRIRRKAVPTSLALDSAAVSIKAPQMFTLQVDPIPDTPRSGMSSSKSFSSGPFDLCSASSSSDAESSPPQTPPHAMVAFSSPPITPLPTSSSESSGLRRSPGMHAGLRVSPSLPLYVPSVHGEIDGWWSSSDDDAEDSQGDEGDIDTESDTSPVPPAQPTFVPVADTAVRRAPGFHVRSASDDSAAHTPRKSFYGNKTAFMSTFFTKPSLSSSSTSSSLNRGATVKAPPSAWDKQTASGPAPKAGRRASLQFLAPRVASVDRDDDDIDEDEPQDSSPKKSFYANNKAFRSVMDLGSMRRASKSKGREEKVPEDAAPKRGIGKFFRKLVI